MPRYRVTTVGDITNQAVARKKISDPKRTADPATLDMLCRVEGTGTITAFDRYVAQQPQCNFGLTGVCCKNCIQGPCRITPRSEASGKGICGAADYTIVARNVARLIAGGTSCHSNHAFHVAETLLKVAEGKTQDYSVKDRAKLHAVAARIGLTVGSKSDLELAKEVALAALHDFSSHEHRPCVWLDTTITQGRRSKFKSCNIAPHAIDRAVVEIIDQTTMGMDADPVNIIFGGLKTALADYTGMHIATDLHDILFGTPRPVATEANLGAIDPEYVMIATHGHNPTLSEMVVEAAEQLAGEARAVGAKGIKVVGICCTGNELLMRQGVALAANKASQEMTVLTGALDAMIVDVQCIMPAAKVLSECYHTQFITTSASVKIPGSQHFDFREENALETAKEMVRLGIEAFGRRNPDLLRIPSYKNQAIAGWSLEALFELFGSVDAENPVRPLTDAILSGELAGVALFAGCNNLRVIQDASHLTVVKELLKNDVFVVATGCSGGAFAKAGLLSPGAYREYGGPGLQAFLGRLEGAATIGMPSVFHMGSCVDNTRAADLLTAMANQLGVDNPKVPFVASAPEAMHEKAVSIGSWAVALGLPVHVGVMPPVEGSPLVYGIVTQIAHDVYGGHFILETDPVLGAKKLLDALEYRSWKLRIHRAAAEKYDTALPANW
ncbi:MAG: anaerobic carbon-monoxide dehydrogenase catalytic subunit [Bacillota bacterium]